MVGEPNSKVKSQKHRPASHCPTSTTCVKLLICQENKDIAAQLQALNQTERSHMAEGFCLGSLHRACSGSGWGGEGLLCRPIVNADAGARGCRACQATRRGPATQGCSCRRGGRESSPHTTPKRLFPQPGP